MVARLVTQVLVVARLVGLGRLGANLSISPMIARSVVIGSPRGELQVKVRVQVLVPLSWTPKIGAGGWGPYCLAGGIIGRSQGGRGAVEVAAAGGCVLEVAAGAKGLIGRCRWGGAGEVARGRGEGGP